MENAVKRKKQKEESAPGTVGIFNDAVGDRQGDNR